MSRIELMPPGSDIFESGADALVNPVDCTGAQGKGLALEFARLFPEPCKSYRITAEEFGRLPGTVWVVPADARRWIFFMTTKRHWREPSKMDYIRTGMADLRAEVAGRRDKISSLAIPALGAGLGRLPWPDVLPIIQSEAKRIADAGIRVLIYPPHSPTTRYTGAKKK